MFKNSLLLLLALLGASGLTLAQDAQESPAQAVSGKTDAPDARGVVARYVSVANLEKRMKAVKSIHVLGKVSISAMGIDGRFEKWSMSGKDLVEMELGALGLSTTGYDGKVAWQSDALTGPRLLDPLEALMAALEVDFDEPLKPQKTYKSVDSIGVETFEGKRCVRVRCILQPAKGMDVAATLKVRTVDELYDLESGLLVAKESTFPSPMGNFPVVSTFGDYKKFEGILMPTRLIQRLPTGDVVILVHKVEFDTVKPERFALPKDVAKLAARQQATGPR